MLSINFSWREHRTRNTLVAGACAMVVVVLAAIVLQEGPRWRHVTVASAERLLALYDTMGYTLQPIRQDASAVPRIDVLSMPEDWPDVTVEDTLKSGFFRTLLPLVLLANRNIADERARLVALQGSLIDEGGLNSSEQDWLDKLATRYGVDRGQDGEPADTVTELLPRVDAVPVSLAIAQAALESGWGRSRFALEGNALFGQWTWEGGGMKPLEAAAGSTHEVARFDSLLASVEAYMLNLNSQGAYADFRKIRAAQRAQGNNPDGLTLASTLVHYSQEGTAYPVKLDRIIRSNELAPFDQATLDTNGTGLVVATP